MRSLLTLCMTTLLLWAAGVEAGAAQLPPDPPPLPPELLGDFPAGTQAQGEADLERTRNALYGRQLSVAQHDEIRSWRPQDLDWWMNTQRQIDAKAKLEALDQLFDTLSDEGDFADAVWNSEDFYGMDVQLEWESAWGGQGGGEEEGSGPAPVLKQATVTYDAAKRPDLFNFYELVHGFAHSVAASPAGEGRFLQAIQPEAETIEGVEAYGDTVTFIEDLKQEIGQLGRHRLRAVMTYLVDFGQTYTAAVADQFQDMVQSEISDLIELRTQQYLESLPEDFRKNLSAHVVERAKDGLFMTRGYYGQTLKEAQAAQFEANIAGLRGGGK